jgi:hypothetical protein
MLAFGAYNTFKQLDPDPHSEPESGSEYWRQN